MDWINYHHLYYFWLTAKLGSTAKAAKELKLQRPTVSAQIAQLQDQLGQDLFEKKGRHNILTRFGKDVFAMADEIFLVGQKLKDFINSNPNSEQKEIRIGVSDILPKVIAYKLISPLLEIFPDVRLICVEGSAERLVSELSVHNIDAIIGDAPIERKVDIRVFHHKLGDCGLAFFCPKSLWNEDLDPFPGCLSELPILFPSQNSNIRRSINLWLENQKINPKIVCEFDDSALMNEFGLNGAGVFVAPSIVKTHIINQYKAICIGHIDSIRDSFYLMSSRKKLENQFIKALVETAKNSLFSDIN